MRNGGGVARVGLAASLLVGAPAAFAQTAGAAPQSADPLSAVIFSGQDAVIDLGPIVPTPGETAAPAPTATATRFTVTHIAANGARDTREIDALELQALGRTAPAAVTLAPAVWTSSTVHAAATATAPAPAPEDFADRDTRAPDAVTPLIVKGAAPKPKTAAFVHDERRYGEKGRFYLFAAGKGAGWA